jgi:hypothetical protein
MEIPIAWDTKHDDVIVYQFPPQWNWQDFLNAFDKELAMAAERPLSPYYVIGDILTSQRLPPGSAITQIHTIYKRYPKNWRSTIILTPSTFIHAMYNIGARMYPNIAQRIRIASNYDDAYALIESMRETQQ